MNRVLFFLLSIFLICAIPNLSYAEQLVCPKAISVQERVGETPDAWTALPDGLPHQLKGIGFYEGHPEKLAALAPEQETKKKGFLYSTWSFNSETAKNLWMSCTYGRTSMTLVRPLNKIYSQCIVKSNPTLQVEGQPMLVSIECK